MSSNNDNALKGGEFKKEVTVFGGVSIVAGIMIGSGIFYLGSYVLQRANYKIGVALLCWLVGGIICMLEAMCFSEIGSSRPKAGGLTVWLQEIYHPIVGYAYGFSQWLLASPGSIAAVAIAIPTALLDFFPGWGDTQVKVIATLLIIGFTLYNILGVKQGSMMANVTLIGKLVPLIIILVAAVAVGNIMPDLGITPVTAAGKASGFSGGVGIIAFATLSSLWAYEGWSNVTNIGEELKNPQKTLPRMLLIGVGGVTVFYILFNFAIYRVIPIEEAKTMIENDNVYLGTEVAKRLFGNVGSILVVAGMLIAMIGSLNDQILAYARIGYAMSQEKHFFKSQGYLSKRGVPAVALITQGAIAVILVLVKSLNDLTSFVVFLGMIGSLLGVVGVLVSRKRFPDKEVSFRVPGGAVTVVITTIICIALMVSNFIDDPVGSVIGVIVVPLVAVAIYKYYDKKNKSDISNKAE